MNVIPHTIETTQDISILPLADLHLGDRHCDEKLIRDSIDLVLKTPGMYTILDGDLMNTAIAGSRSDVYTETLTPQEELQRCVELFKPLADAGKILAVLPGNHESRISRSVGVDMTALMCEQLGIGHLYSPTSALVYLRFGDVKHADKDRSGKTTQRKLTYSIYVRHGNGGGKRAGGKINTLEDMAKTITADVYLSGHTHMPASFRQNHIVCNPQNLTVSQKEQLFVNTASFLDWSGSYGDAGGFQPNSKKMPVITLSATEHLARCTV